MNKKSRILFFFLLLSIISGIVCDFLYNSSPNRTIQIEKFQSQLNKKEQKADIVINDIANIIDLYSVDSLINYPLNNEEISYYVYDKDSMVFWSDNHLDIGSLNLSDSLNWHFVLLRNSYCVSRILKTGSKRIVALITIKNNYPYENDELSNNFSEDFNLNKKVEIVNGKPTDKLAVFCLHGNYLFTLEAPKIPLYNENWAIAGLIAYTLAFLLFIIIYSQLPKVFGKEKLSVRSFVLLSVSVAVFLGFALYFNLPNLLFLNKLFSPFQYASNPVLASIVHLSIVTGYFISTIYLFYFNVDRNKLNNIKSTITLQIIYAIYFGLVFYILNGLIYHSSIQLSILHFDDFSGVNIWIHFLLLLWGIGLALLFFIAHQIDTNKVQLKKLILTDLFLLIPVVLFSSVFSKDNTLSVGVWYIIIGSVFYFPFIFKKWKNIYGYIAVWLLIYTAFLVWNSLVISENKMFEKYYILAQNIYINGNTENDRMADILLEGLDEKIINDPNLIQLDVNSDSVLLVNSYLNNTYFRGFWNKYDMKLNVVYKNSDLNSDYKRFIQNVGTRLKNTHFYSVPANENNMSYIGAFPVVNRWTDSLMFYMEFYPRRNFRSYSFPNLLISAAPNIQTKLNISIAKYENNNLVFSSGNVNYSTTNDWIANNRSEFYSFIYNGLLHYVYKVNATTKIIITEQIPYKPINNLLYFIYLFLTYFSVCWLIIWLFYLVSRKRNYRLGLTAKFQYTFILLLIISFVGIFYVSVNFIQRKYQAEQISNLNNKKNYIQKELQEMYYWNQDLNYIDFQKLNFDLQDLSYIYHTDIHVYNNQGILVGSSQPLIFNKSLISDRITPKPFFAIDSNINQYEHIGKLNYLTGYTDFYNGDYLQIGYIAIPQFFSQNEIRAEIESFLTVILHIYIIIIVLAVLLSLFIGRQLSAPLYMIENKLKEMRLGQRNEKIEYALNDEIGQLVLQYNRTVDELEQSAMLLAKSERETAWKSMARQVAHEINNPLTPMKLTIQQMQRTKNMNDERFDEYFKKSTDMLIEQIDNLSRIAGTFSNFARMPEARFEKVDIAVKLYSVVQLFRNNNEEIQIKFSGNDEGVYVYADPEQLVQVFNNLLKNAIQAIPPLRRGKILVGLKTEKNYVVIEIKDNGSGIPDDICDKLFVPNFTTKNTGMGLGLAISKNIIEISGGSISFTTVLDEGTIFRVSIPMAE